MAWHRRRIRGQTVILKPSVRVHVILRNALYDTTTTITIPTTSISTTFVFRVRRRSHLNLVLFVAELRLEVERISPVKLAELGRPLGCGNNMNDDISRAIATFRRSQSASSSNSAQCTTTIDMPRYRNVQSVSDSIISFLVQQQ